MALTDEQQQKLEDRRLSEGSRPSYYDSVAEDNVEIGEAFEEFLILLDPEVREEINDRLEDAAEVDTDFEAIFKRAASFDAEDANTMRESYDSALGDFSTFRTTVLSQHNSSAVEVAAIQTDVRRTQGRLVAEMDELQHRAQVADFLVSIHDQNVNNFAKKKQRDSWSAVFAEYE